jgi:hypothetical protein
MERYGHERRNGVCAHCIIPGNLQDPNFALYTIAYMAAYVGYASPTGNLEYVFCEYGE